MTAPDTVTCARCQAEYPENSDEVRYAYGDWWCTDSSACDNRMEPTND